MGFYKGEGLNIQRVGMNNGPAGIAALLGGEGASDFSTPGEALGADAKGQDLRTIMAMSNYTVYTLIVGKEFAARYKLNSNSTPQERKAALAAAKGAKFGITAPGSLTDALVRIAITAVGNNPVTDAAMVPLGGIAPIIAAIDNQRVDGFFGPSPVIEQAMAQIGAYGLITVEEVPEAKLLQGQVQIARGEDIVAHPDLYAALVRAQLKAMQAINEKPDEAAALLAKTRFSNLKPEIWQTAWNNERQTFQSPYVTLDALRGWIVAGLVGGNPDPATFPYDKVIDMRFVDEGLKKVGWKPHV